MRCSMSNKGSWGWLAWLGVLGIMAVLGGISLQKLLAASNADIADVSPSTQGAVDGGPSATGREPATAAGLQEDPKEKQVKKQESTLR